MKYVECEYCGEHIDDGELAYTDWCDEVFCSVECAQNYYAEHLEYGHIFSDLNTDLDWLGDDDDDANNDDD